MAHKIEPVLPPVSASLTLKVEGIYALPDEWKATDDANPGMFTYSLKLATIQVANGKVHARELTEKQLRQQEESKKKGGKKDGKKEENPAEAEKLKQLLQKEEEQERKREEAWNKLSPQQQFYHGSEDSYKSNILKFDPSDVEVQLKDKNYAIFSQHVLKDGGEWVYVFKTPTANQQQLAKMRKTKPKTLANVNDLNPVIMRAWVNLSQLNSNEVSCTTQRCKLEQIDASDDSPKPNLEKTYVKIQVNLAEPLVKKPDSLNCSAIIKDPPQPPVLPADVKCVEELREEIKIALESLAMEYSAMFQKELNSNQEQRLSNIFANNRKNEPIRRKEQFLYDFNISGKYRVLKERLKKAIVHVCQHKFADKMNGAKSFTGVSCSVRDQFYSQIYNFLVTEYSSTMGNLVKEKKQILGDVLVLNNEHQEQASEEYLQSFIKQTKEERLERIISEYLLIGNVEYGVELYQKQIRQDPNNLNTKYQYSLYCIRNGLKTVKEAISEGFIDQYMQQHKSEAKCRLNYVLLMIASENQANLNKGWIILREILAEDPSNVQLLLLAATLFDQDQKYEESAIFFLKACRQKLRQLGRIAPEGSHRENPQPSEIPSLSSGARYTQELTGEQKDGLWSSVMGQFAQLGLLNIVSKLNSKIENHESNTFKKQNLRILSFEGKHEQCVEQCSPLFRQSKDMGVFDLLINSLNRLGRLEESQKYLKMGLKLAPEEDKIKILLRLGSTYLQAKQFGNSKACISKYLQKTKPSGGLSWKILGLSELHIGNYEQAAACFRFSNLSDPYDADVWLSMAKAYAGLNNLVMVNQCLNSYEKFSQNKSHQQLQEFLGEISGIKQNNFYEASMKAKIALRSESK